MIKLVNEFFSSFFIFPTEFLVTETVCRVAPLLAKSFFKLIISIKLFQHTG